MRELGVLRILRQPSTQLGRLLDHRLGIVDLGLSFVVRLELGDHANRQVVALGECSLLRLILGLCFNAKTQVDVRLRVFAVVEEVGVLAHQNRPWSMPFWYARSMACIALSSGIRSLFP